MGRAPEISPGTVSKILWHFTGGPQWNPKTQKQESQPKSARQAYRNLKSILQSKELRLGTYKELVKIRLPEVRSYNLRTRRVDVRQDVPITIESSPVCCLCDIPAPHLRYHAHRYGKFAVGFHRDAVINAGFNPVFYTLEDTPIIRSIYEGWSSLAYADPWVLRGSVEAIESQWSDIESEQDNIEVDLSSELSNLQHHIDSIDYLISRTKENLEAFVAFVKTFNLSEFNTVYCEREWRSTKSYRFSLDEVAMIVLPRSVAGCAYYEEFISSRTSRLRIPRKIPIVPWDDLVEH